MPLSELLDGFGVESPAYVVIRFMLYAGITMLVGSLSLLHIILPRMAAAPTAGNDVHERIAQRTIQWMQWSVIALVPVTVLRLAAQHAAFFGSRGWSRATLQPLLWQSEWGTGWLLAAGALLTVLVGIRRVRSDEMNKRTFSWALVVAGMLAFVWSTAMSGHAAAADSATLAKVLDALHIIGAGGWVGSLALIVFVAIPAHFATASDDAHRGVARLVSAFSPVALLCAAILGVSGVVAGWRNMGGIDALFTSDYGLMLVRKLVVVAVVAMIGAYNWKRVLPRLGEAVGTRRLRTSAALEVTAAVVVLALTAVLVATSPP